MPKVPTNGLTAPRLVEPPDETSLALAAGMMYSEGKLFEPTQMAESNKVPWSRLGEVEHQQLLSGAYEPKTEGERNKYDETLYEHGSVILDSKKAFGPKKWQDKNLPEDVDRYDLPDGRVLLKLRGNKALTS